MAGRIATLAIVVICVALVPIVRCGAATCWAVETCGNGDVSSVVAVVKADGLCGLLRIRGLEGESMRGLETVVLPTVTAVWVIGAMLLVLAWLIVMVGLVLLPGLEVSWREAYLLVVAV